MQKKGAWNSCELQGWEKEVRKEVWEAFLARLYVQPALSSMGSLPHGPAAGGTASVKHALFPHP